MKASQNLPEGSLYRFLMLWPLISLLMM